MYLCIYSLHPPRASTRRPHLIAMTTRQDRIGEFATALEKNRRIILRTQVNCGICGQPVNKRLKAPDPMSATVDHIIPLSKGGHPSDLSNLQLAHRWCNRAKSNKIFMARDVKELQEDKEINNDDLPQHYDWSRYEAS